MLNRLLHGLGVLGLLGALAWLLAAHADPLAAAAADLRGERWYKVVLHDRQIGYLRTDTRRDPLGRWHFDSELHFVLSAREPVITHETLLFDAAPPYPLLQARQSITRAGRADGTRIDRDGDGYRVSRLSGDAATALTLRYDLEDHLGFEAWLRESQAPAGVTRAVRSLDFGRRQVVARQFRVVDRNATGYRIESAGPVDPSSIQLDGRLRPVVMSLSGLFQLELADRDVAAVPGRVLQAPGHFVPVNRPLPQHTEIRTLALEVEGSATAAELWPELADGNAVHHTAGRVATARLIGDELAETADHPVSDPRIRALAQRAVAGAESPAAQLAALTRFVNDYLRYTDDGVGRDVLSLLDEPRGDCNAYADLLTTLARALAIPSRTVFGLAYAAQDQPAFRFHAWNELLVDGEWQAVDPTWNQLRVDATHIPLPRDIGHAMSLLTGALDLRFNVREVEYF